MAAVRRKTPAAKATTSQAAPEPETIEITDPVEVPPGFVAIWTDSGATCISFAGVVHETVGNGVFHVPAAAVADLVGSHGFFPVEG
jgi:hypothetical protein